MTAHSYWDQYLHIVITILSGTWYDVWYAHKRENINFKCSRSTKKLMHPYESTILQYVIVRELQCLHRCYFKHCVHDVSHILPLCNKMWFMFFYHNYIYVINCIDVIYSTPTFWKLLPSNNYTSPLPWFGNHIYCQTIHFRVGWNPKK